MNQKKNGFIEKIKKYLVISTLAMMALSGTVMAKQLWQYGAYGSTPASGFIYSTPEQALQAIGKIVHNGNKGSYTEYFQDIVNFYCQGNACYGTPRFLKCDDTYNQTPGTAGKWRYDTYFTEPASGYDYSDGISALNAVGGKYYSGLHGSNNFFFVDLSSPACYSNICGAHFKYKSCSTLYSQSLSTEGKWRYDGKANAWTTTSDSAYDYNDPFSALEAMAQKHYNASYTDGDGNTITLAYVSYEI